MPITRLVRGLIAAVFICGSVTVHGEWLVTPEEVTRFRDEFAAPLWLAKAAGDPVIEVARPALIDGHVLSPMAIELNFRAAADASIDPNTFRVYYGTLKLDVTQRLLKNVAVRVDGLHVDRAEIPAGSHWLVMQVSDTRQRTATQDLRFVVQ